MDDAARPFTIDNVFAQAAKLPAFADKGALSDAARSFLEQMHEDAGGEPFGDEAALGAAHEFWAWTANKPAAEQWVRLRHANGRDVLEIAGPDMPFLVRSVMGEVNEQGLAALALFHPIVAVARDHDGKRLPAGGTIRESYIQVQFEPLGDRRDKDLLEGVERTLRDVRLAVADFAALKAKMAAAAEALARAPANAAPADEIAESVAFLRWLEDDNFTFLGARDYDFHRTNDGGFIADEPIVLSETGLGLLRDPQRYVLRRSDEPSLLTAEIKRFIEEPTPLIVSKSNLRSSVHRRAAADYIGVKRYDAAGMPIGETRFIGLFTADAYNRSTHDIPLLRRKVARVLEASEATPGSHDHSVLRNILETFPRDELFQISELELLDISLGILHLTDRPRARVFARRDRFNRFVSALAFVPKERFNSTLREAIGKALVRAFGGVVEAFYPTLGEGPLARIHFIIQGIDRNRPAPDSAKLDAEIAALTRTWDDGLQTALRESGAFTDNSRAELTRRFTGAFTAGYRERFDAAEALTDIAEIEALGDSEPVSVRAYRLATDGPEKLRCKLYSRGKPLSLSAIVPVLENMGLFIESEDDLAVTPAGQNSRYWIHDLDMRTADGAPLKFETVERSFEAAFTAAWDGRAENDGFNRLILKLGISWREAALIRALARYRTQTGMDPGQSVQEQALANHPDIVGAMLGLFRVRFDPTLEEDVPARKAWGEGVAKQIDDALNKVSSLDEDRVLRRIARLIDAVQRTNFYQTDERGAPKTYISFKIASPALDDLPLPKPYREIFVWSPQVEGVHLRFGPVARGGLRWSDRRDDFRTETLNLAKAQHVKNSIIVPVGAKGGFFPKTLPRGGKPAEIRAAGVEAYKTFLRGLLDITDDIEGDHATRPQNVVCWDEEDPYLVVAADKGTATFSDIANGVSAEYGFWLGDAFASGGSAGYDHKAMGITARGAWEAVKRHFREMGVNTQTTPFDVVGVGDMSGDVFGNGMLQSKKIRLIAAFDHRDIFIDPEPADLDAAWTERKRLFDLPASSWQDYDRKLISAGGGVFSRTAKTVTLSPEMKKLTGLIPDSVPVADLLSALLTAQCDLLWFGGIGTFIKAAAEAHADAGDKTNDSCRVDAEAVRAKVIGEGANLGVTQPGRIAYARAGGRINTDAVDNSAGVDTSDHEVNIKILLTDAERTSALKAAERNPLLAAMTDEVAAHVLAHNYDQTLAMSVAEACATPDHDANERMIVRLESQGKLNRKVEGLPNTAGFADLREKGLGLTRPELSKLIAYAKIDLSDTLAASAAPDDPYFEQTLVDYFPTQLRRFEDSMKRHRLRRDIIATTLADAVVNIAGPTFIDRVCEAAQTKPHQAALAFAAARAIYRADELAERVNALDNQIPARVQIGLHRDIAASLRRATIALSRRLMAEPNISVGALIERYAAPVEAQRVSLWGALSTVERDWADNDKRGHVAAGAPSDLAQDITALAPLTPAIDIADLARVGKVPPETAALIYRALGAALSLDALRAGAGGLRLSQHFERLALRRLLTELHEDQRLLAQKTLASAGAAPTRAGREWAEQAVRQWLAKSETAARPALAAIEDMQSSGPWTFAKIVLAVAALRAFAASA